MPAFGLQNSFPYLFEGHNASSTSMTPICSLGLLLSRVLSSPMRTAHPQTPLPLRQLLLAHDVVVLAEVTGLLPDLHHLSLVAGRDGPDVLAKPLVPLAVLLDALLDL